MSVEAILANDAVLPVEARKIEEEADAAAALLRKADIRVMLSRVKKRFPAMQLIRWRSIIKRESPLDTSHVAEKANRQCLSIMFSR